VFEPPFVGPPDLIDNGLSGFGVGLPRHARLEIHIQNPRSNRLCVGLVEVLVPQAAGSLQTLSGAIKIVEPLDGSRQLLAPKGLKSFDGHALDGTVERPSCFRKFMIEARDM
jgi:hypothetical protein